MSGKGRLPLIGALICFLAFFGNVTLGAAGLGAPLGDVAEMLTLFLACLLFVAGVLQREAAAKHAEEQSLLNTE